MEASLAGGFSVISEHADVVIKNLHEPAFDLQYRLAAAIGIRERASAQRAEQRRVPGQDTHVAIFARQLRHSDLLIHIQTVRCGDFQLKRIRHGLALHLRGGFHHIFNGTLQIKRLFRQRIVLTVHNFAEAAHGVFHLDVLTGTASELFRDVERL
jgi:hypothetical protein